MVEEFLSLTLVWFSPVPGLTIVDPGPLNIFRWGVLDKSRSLRRPKVPDGLHVLVLRQVLRKVISITCDDVDHATRKIGSVENLGKNLGFVTFIDAINLLIHK